MNFSLRYFSLGLAAVLTLFVVTNNAYGQGEQVAKNITDVKVVDIVLTEEPRSDRPVSILSGRPLMTRVGVQSAEPISLSLDEAIRRALANNNDIDVSRDDVRIQETQIRSLRGSYDPVFTINPNYSRNSITGSAATNDFSVNSDLRHAIQAGGGNYTIFFNNTRTENAFSQAQVSNGNISGGSSAIYSSSLGIRYTQPLVRNFSIDNTRRNLKIARRRLEQSDADFRRTTIETIARVQNAYWDLVFALRDQQNRVANLELSKENLRQVEARIAAGASAPLARAEVATELANRESDVLVATQQVSIAENTLKQLLLRDSTSVEWSQSYMPTDKPAFSLDAISLDNAVKDAMDNRYELQRLKLAADINKIDVNFFRNQTRPQIDLNTTFSLDGLARGGASTDAVTFPLIATENSATAVSASGFLLAELRRLFPGGITPVPNVTVPGTPSYLSGVFGRSMSNLFRSDAPNYSVGVTFSFPIGNRTAKANLAGAEITKHQLETQTRIQEQVVMVEVRNAVQAVETARQRVLAARRARENAEIQLDGERKLFDAGKSTSFLLFQRENSLANARNAEIRAETDYNKAVANLQKATSTTFQMNNIEVVSPVEKK
ncbi:MAG: TolC family protein [Pyrinomonadaceae bacterium]|nr:TolC family protein [Pyrinomonadaceae bacterium]